MRYSALADGSVFTGRFLFKVRPLFMYFLLIPVSGKEGQKIKYNAGLIIIYFNIVFSQY